MKNLLRNFVTQVLKEQLDFGNELFGDVRKKGEPDTTEEKELSKKLYMWYHGRVDSLSDEDAKVLSDLAKSGKYVEVLNPGPGPFYRLLSLPKEVSMSWAGKQLSKQEIVGLIGEKNEKEFSEEADAFMLKSGFSYSNKYGNVSKSASSWTTDKGMMEHQRNTDQRGLRIWKGGSIAFLKVDSPRPGDFVFNPKEMSAFSEQFSYQSEAIQVAPTVQVNDGFIVVMRGDNYMMAPVVEEHAVKMFEALL